MRSALISSLFILALSIGLAQSGSGFGPEYYQAIVDAAKEELREGRLTSGEQLEEAPRESRATLSCPNLAGGTATSVHALKPSDISVIGAIGDSLTAANGAKARSILFVLDEYRGVSWSIGCETDLSKTVTFATILKWFNPSLYGCSTDTSKQNGTHARLNLAHPGDTSFDMLSQAKLLVQRIQSNVADYNNKWKIINLFIGGNDLCETCSNPRQTPDNFRNNIRDALDYFQQNLPRTLVNVALTLDVSGVEILTGSTCRNMQNSLCDCALKTSFRPTLLDLTAKYQEKVDDLINNGGRYDTSDLFTVVSHHFMRNMKPPKTPKGDADYSYFAPDCFHFSQKGHEAAGTELWNSMMTHHDDKNWEWTLGSAIKCPSLTNPYIHTNKNVRSLKSILSR